MAKLINFFLITILLAIPSITYSKKFKKFKKFNTHHIPKEKIVLLETVESKNSIISYVTIEGLAYLIKQKKVDRVTLASVRDALAAHVAKVFNIAHRVYIIGDTKEFPGKTKSDWPATLHTIAGKTIKEQEKNKYKKLQLKQWWRHAKNFDEKGLTRLIINHMSWHKQLPIIVALDLFIGNTDRHIGNLCYNPDTDTFCAIDMDDTFNKDLCNMACKKLKLMMHDDECVFTLEEINALEIMNEALKILVHKYRPAYLIKKLHYFADQAGFSEGKELYIERISHRLLWFEKVIHKTHASTYKLIDVLHKLIKRKLLQINNNGENNVVV